MLRPRLLHYYRHFRSLWKGIHRMRVRTLIAGLAILALSGVATAQDEIVAKGEKVYKKCKTCHSVGEGARNKVGPHQKFVSQPDG